MSPGFHTDVPRKEDMETLDDGCDIDLEAFDNPETSRVAHFNSTDGRLLRSEARLGRVEETLARLEILMKAFVASPAGQCGAIASAVANIETEKAG